ncbi:organic cation transporter 1-like [Uloborus diversus]|uniref:organic cation transporter 1-like n=1 Tax=Uloborus diversus TaxID=327109 RepID=UPI00240A7770|nr:organic cation transporter 1-like [Uloborus diversus]
MENLEFEDILLELGDFGPYQRNLMIIFLLPASFILPWLTMNMIFMVTLPEHWCNVPEVAASNLSIELQRSLISPATESSCRMRDLNYTDLLMSDGPLVVPENASTKPCDNGWLYDTSEYDSTIATQWDLVCDDYHYVSFVLLWWGLGTIIATPVYGALSDKIGRRLVFFVVAFVAAVSSVASVLVKDFTAFIILKTIHGFLKPSLFQLPFIIVLELVAPAKRTRMNGMSCIIWSVGAFFVPLIAYLTHGWIANGLFSSAVTFIFFAYWKFIPESPRWLVSKHRYDEAVDILAEIGEKNGKPQDRKILLSKLKKLGEKMVRDKEFSGSKHSTLDLLKYPQLRKTFIIVSICWIADVFAYDGLQLNVINLSGNEFLNFFLLILAEIPGYMTSWYLMDRIGRRWCTAVGFLLTGLICFLPIFRFPHVDLISSIIGKYLGAAAYMATYQQSSELYPTVVRSLGMGMSSSVAAVVSLIVPYIVYFSIYGKAIPFVIIGFLCLIAGVLATLLPESLNENLPQSIQDREEFGKDQKFFSFNRKRPICEERAESFKMKHSS